MSITDIWILYGMYYALPKSAKGPHIGPISTKPNIKHP